MSDIKHILIVCDRSELAGNILEKAATLAAANNAQVHIIRVIHEDLVEYGKMSAEDAQKLKVFIMQAEEEYLIDLIGDYRDRFSEMTSATIWNKRVSTAVKNVVADLDIDFVLKSTVDGGAHFPRHPDDWNLVREAQCPVLFVGPEPWSEKPKITAAVDVFNIAHEEINRRILDTADALTNDLDGVLDIVCVYPTLVNWSLIGRDFDELRRDIERELQICVDELVEGLSSQVESVRMAEGVASHIIKILTDQSNSDVVVVGTAARTGVSAWVIGNTSEALLDRVSRDLLILHV